MGSTSASSEEQSSCEELENIFFQEYSACSSPLVNLIPRAASPDLGAEEGSSSSPSPPGLVALSPLSCLECSPPSYDAFDPVSLCVSPQEDHRIEYRSDSHLQRKDDSLFSEELTEAYSRGTLHSFFWKMMITEDEASKVPFEWKGHRPLDPAYPVKRATRIGRPMSPPVPILQQTAIHSSPRDIEVVLPRVCS